MSKSLTLNVTSEIGKLKGVLVHKPGRELERLTPDLLQELLFDDIPWLRKVQKEHDEFADALRGRGAEVYYVQELLAETLNDNNVKKDFVEDLFINTTVKNEDLVEELKDLLNGKSGAEVAEIAIAGLAKKEVSGLKHNNGLWDEVYKDHPLYINPVPNLYFMRDPAAGIANGLSINCMQTVARNREPMMIKYIYKNHPMFQGTNENMWYNENMPNNMEGGDMLVLSKSAMAIGVSERTSPGAIETLAKTLFAKDENMKEILAVQIPSERAFMHLDTVFTMVDYDQFTIFPGIAPHVKVYSLTKDGNGIKITPKSSLKESLESVLSLPSVNLIESGGGDSITAAREQWNDSTNTLAIAPGVVVTYNRNEVSNETLRKNNIEVIEVEGSELVRGRGGPRCMSCPIVREDI